MISNTAEYALRAMTFLAAKPTKPWTTQEIAAATKLPAKYLAKVLEPLVRARLLQSQRGVGGGFMLARAADAVSLLEIINVLDPIRRIHTCPLGIQSHGTNLCPLHRRMDNAFAVIEQTFGQTTLADLLDEPLNTPNCVFPLDQRPSTAAPAPAPG